MVLCVGGNSISGVEGGEFDFWRRVDEFKVTHPPPLPSKFLLSPVFSFELIQLARGVLPKFQGGSVPLGPQNPDPVPDQERL